MSQREDDFDELDEPEIAPQDGPPPAMTADDGEDWDDEEPLGGSSGAPAAPIPDEAAGESAGAAPATGSEEPAKRQPTRALTTNVLRLANRVHGAMREAGHPELADRITSEAKRWGDASLTFIVAGDIKRGKSSLLNALVSQTDLLPVDADVATAVHLVLRYGEENGVEVTRVDESGAVVTVPADPTDLVDLASMHGDEEQRRGVTNVDVLVPNPLLQRGLVLVDTPGVGGMTRGHRDITMAALQRADALLFTISAQEPVSRTELEFLAEASERIGNVVFVVTKSDLNTDEQNADMLAEDQDKLRTHLAQLREAGAAGDERAQELARRFERLLQAPFVLTSSFLAEQAERRAAAGREDAAERYRQRSGLDRLEHLIDRSLEVREDVRLANICQLLGLLLAQVEGEHRDRLRALNDDHSVEDEMAARQATLETFVSQQARWRGSLATGIQRLQTEAGRKVARELNLVRNHYRDILQNAADVEALMVTLPDELERSLHAAWNNLSAQANEDFAGIVANLLGEFGIEGMEHVLGDLEIPGGLRELIDRTGDTTQDFTLLDDGVPLAMQTFMFGNVATAGLAAVGIATGGIGLVAYGIGAAVAVPLMKMRRRQREKLRTVGEFNRVLNEALFGAEGIAKEFTTELTLRILDTRERIERSVDERLVQRRKELESQQRELRELMRTEVATRGRAKQEAEKMVAGLEALGGEVEKLRLTVEESMRGGS